MKDNFSDHSADYAQYRPTYPQELYDFLFSFIKPKDNAWDCATGNGQVAVALAKEFKQVWATDLSENQLKEAVKRDNITYDVHTAEQDVPYQNHFDLITVAQAIHWFNFEKFYANVNHALKTNGVLAVMGYSLLETSGELNKVIKHFYKEITGPFWDEEREYLDEGYRTILFPFEELTVPEFKMEVQWSQEQLLNYLNTWSAVKHYQDKNGENPLNLIKKDVETHWGSNEKRMFEFPLLVRVGTKKEGSR